MASTTQTDPDSGIRVVVTPSQSCYFAGEPFTVTITFTNTRTSPAPSPSRSQSHTHKRGAHSISSAPISRPPTSPGLPRPLAPPPTKKRSVDDVISRKRLIGREEVHKGSDTLPDLIEQRRKRLLGKSLSVVVAPNELPSAVIDRDSPVSASAAQTSFSERKRISPTSPKVASPLSRTDMLSLASTHPHARKHSVLDGKTDVTISTTSVPQPVPYTPSSSTSSFSLSLDTISETSPVGYPPTPSTSQPSVSTPVASVFHPNGLRHTRAQSQAQIGLGYPTSSTNVPRTAFSTTFPNASAELILYSYAQLLGALTLTPVPGAQPTTAEQSYTLTALRSTLLKRKVVGGGSMDITSTLHSRSTSVASSPRRKGHSRSSSFSSGLLTLLSPASLVSSTSSPAGSATSWTGPASGRPRTMSASSSSPSYPSPSNPATSPGLSAGLGIGFAPSPNGLLSPGRVTQGMVYDEDVDPDAPLPTFEVQPAMLAVDLTLLPGESRTYTYTVPLPSVLPPTFRGRALRFSYELVVGTCRASGGQSSGSSSKGVNSISRVMRVPIRIYNHVSVGRPGLPYDLLWPINKQFSSHAGKSSSFITEAAGTVKEVSSIPTPDSLHDINKVNGHSNPSVNGKNGTHGSSPKAATAAASDHAKDDLKKYAQRLLNAFPDPQASGVRIKLPAESIPVHVESVEEVDDMQILQSKSNGIDADFKRWERERQLERDKEVGALTGCREAVEILTRNPKKASYDVNKDGVKVAVLTFTKSAYRLGETITGVVEINERTSRSRVLQLSASLESHESLPTCLASTPNPSLARHLRRLHAEHHSSFTLNTLRTTFCLDIPSDASPAFQVKVGGSEVVSSPMSGTGYPTVLSKPGGLEWKVRLCLSVAIAAETSKAGTEGVRVRSLVRDGQRGEWSSSWRPTPTIAPLEKPKEAPIENQPRQSVSWASFIASSLLGTTESTYHDGDEETTTEGYSSADDEDGEYDGIKADESGGVGVGVNFGGGERGWVEMQVETVECEVPIKVWPGNTVYKPLDVVFDL